MGLFLWLSGKSFPTRKPVEIKYIVLFWPQKGKLLVKDTGEILVCSTSCKPERNSETNKCSLLEICFRTKIPEFSPNSFFKIQPRKTRIILEWGVPLRKNFAREYTRTIGNYVILSSVCKIIICVCCFFVLCCLNLSVLRRQLFDELAYFLFLLLN